MEKIDSLMFELSPIPMWLEDFSEVQQQFSEWRAQGIENLADFLAENPDQVLLCVRKIRILKVNQRTLDLVHADNFAQLQAQLDCVFRVDMSTMHVKQLLALWQGESFFSGDTINYTLTGQRLDIQVRGFVLPEYQDSLARVLVTTEDITPYKAAARQENDSRELAEAFFMFSPVALIMEDFSAIKQKLDALRSQNIDDFPEYLRQHPEFMLECFSKLIIQDVNQATLDLLKVRDLDHLIQQVPLITSHPQNLATLAWQLNELWHYRIRHQRESVFYTSEGDLVHVVLQFTVFPGHEAHWDRLQIALTDISARKQAEQHLQFLSQHDVLTNLSNRAVYSHEVERLEQQRFQPLSCIFIDMNGLKPINDIYGHASGDELLKRTGHIIGQVVCDETYTAARIGGDEFVILLPQISFDQLQAMIEQIKTLIRGNNQHYTHQISLSIGFASRQHGESVLDMLKRADQCMYLDKQRHYQSLNQSAEMRRS